MSRLRKQDLLEILLELSKENHELREKNSNLEAQLQERALTVSQAGSLAEAALQLNGVFKAAQDACDQYILNTRLRCQKMEADTKSRCTQMLNEIRCRVNEKEDCE